MRKLLLPLAITVLLGSCKKEIAETEFEDFAVEQVSEKDCNPEEENCTFIKLHTPLAKPQTEHAGIINENIEGHINVLMDYQNDRGFRSLEALVQQFIDDYEASATEFPEYDIPWEASVEGKLVHQSPEVISIEYELALFTGGAHGYSSVSYLNFDPETGEKFSSADLFTPEFKSFAEDLFRKKNDIPKEQNINSTGFFFEEDQFQLPQNIGFFKNKIVLRYNPYEVASYAEGRIDLEIPIKDARPFIKIL